MMRIRSKKKNGLSIREPSEPLLSFSGYRPTVSVVAIILMLACRATTSIAHPHVWINYRLEILLVEGKLTAINQQWDFDQDYSSMLLHDQVKEHR